MSLIDIIRNQQKARSIPGLLAIVVMLALAMPAQAQSNRELDNRMKRLENEIETLSRAVYRGEKPPPGSFSGGSAAGADIEIRLQQMESELRAMRGQLEEQSYKIRQLENQLERATSDMELRLNDLEGRGGASAPAPSSSRYTTDGGKQGFNTTLPNEPKPKSDSYEWSSDNSGGNGQLGSYTQSPQGDKNPSADLAAATYENAFSLIKNAKYDAAEREFQAFLNAYPDHVLAGNAKYWLGETFYVRGEYDRAARIFAEGYQQYPKGAKAPDNLLKLGMSLAGMGKTSDACVALEQLVKKKVAGSGPVMRRAEQEISRLKC